MALERTLSIVKPDGIQKNAIGDVYRRFEQRDFRIIAARMMRLSVRRPRVSTPCTASARSFATS
jgi:nucleoside-diphosphate kinase